MSMHALENAFSQESGDPVAGHTIQVERSRGFVATSHIEQVSRRALAYLCSGFPVHFSGPAGVGKTSLAFHLASQLGAPVMLMHGDNEFGSSNLVGSKNGVRHSRVVDNFIHSVVKIQEESHTTWVDNKLTIACQYGYTLIYDEFNRSRAEANNVLLSVLAEGILTLPRDGGGRQSYVPVHPSFRILFTSNPDEYAGVHTTQDALMDRMITIHLDHHDRDSEVAIVMARTGCPGPDAEIITDIVRTVRSRNGKSARPTIRAAVTIGKILAKTGARATPDDETFVWLCHDVLASSIARVTHNGQVSSSQIMEIVRSVCEQHARGGGASGVTC